MSSIQLLVLTAGVPVVAWLVAVAATRPPRPAPRPIDERFFFGYMAVAFVIDAYSDWTQDHPFRSGVWSTMAAYSVIYMCLRISQHSRSRHTEQNVSA